MPLRNSSRQRVQVQALAAPNPLPVPVLEQEQDEWCWAACIVMVLRYRGDPATQQCQLAAERTGYAQCCQDPLGCDCPCPVPMAGQLYNQVGLPATLTLGAPPFATFTSEFAAARPVHVATSADGTGHALLVTWAGQQNAVPHLRLIDPLIPALVLKRYSHVQNEAMAAWTGL